MSRRAAVLGLGARGRVWAEAFQIAGWEVRAFDPDPEASCPILPRNAYRREDTISATVQASIHYQTEDALLLQKVIQRAQAEAPKDTLIGVVTREFGIDDVQSCALRPAMVIVTEAKDDGGYACAVTPKTDPAARATAEKVLAELAALGSIAALASLGLQPPDAESA